MKYRMPNRWVYFILIISILPIILSLIGFNFTTLNISIPEENISPKGLSSFQDLYFQLFLKWAGISAAFFSAIFVALYAKVRKEPSIILIAIALFTSGLMDLLETLAISNILFTVSDMNTFLQDSWVISGGFFALILVLAACISIANIIPFFLRNNSRSFMTLIFLSFVSYALINSIVVMEALPKLSIFGDSVSQSWNVFVLLFYLCISSIVFFQYNRKQRTVFSHAILLSLVPCILAQVHMTFASTSLFDSHYTIAQFLKVFTYLIPFIALSHEYLRISKENDRAKYVVHQAELAKNHFLNNMSHQLRTPLNTIIGFSECMQDGMDGRITEHQSKVLAKISKAGHHLLFLINNILNISKIEANRFDISPKPVNIIDIVYICIQDLDSFAKEKSLEIHLSCEYENLTLEIDGPKVQQALMNLLNNSIKFSERGTVEVSIRKATKTVEIDVIDHGEGISSGLLTHIFEPFQQQDTAPLFSVQGAGLGLAISKKIIELHQGHLYVTTTKGKGSIFTISLPISPEESQSAKRKKSSTNLSNEATPYSTANLSVRDDNNGKVLIIDDDPNVIELITKHLVDTNYLSTSITDPRKSIESIQKYKPDFILLDLVMPQANGWQILEKIKAHPEAKKIPVAIISSLDEQAEASKFTGLYFLSKPISQENLLDFLQNGLKNKI
ncbi:MAG: signal transduction histidine kinase [Chlamydiales bacterium]|jgi:signal transduction histidine kinase